MHYLLSGIIATIVSVAALLGLHQPAPVAGQTQVLPIAGQTYYLAGSGVSSSATSMTLTSFTLPQNGYKIQDSDVSDTFYITLEPGNRTKQEIVSCTTVTQNAAGTATLSGCTRGLSPVTPYTASSTLQFAHGGSTQVIFSNPPQLYNQFVAKDNDGNVTGLLRFTTSPYGSTPTSSDQLATKFYADSLSITGAPTSTEVTMGVSVLGSNAGAAAGTASTSSGKPYVLPQRLATSTPLPCCWTNVIPVTNSLGQISSLFIATSSSYAWTASTTFSGSGTTTLNSIVSIIASSANKLWVAGLSYVWPTTRAASSTVLSEDGSGNLHFVTPKAGTISVNGLYTSSTNTATTTVSTVTIPANTLTTSQALRVNAAMVYQGGASSCEGSLVFGSGSSTTTLAYFGNFNTIFVTGTIFATSSAAEISNFMSYGNAAVASSSYPATLYSTYNFPTVSLTAQSYIGFNIRSQAGATCTFTNESVELISN